MSKPLLASELYAISQGWECKGPVECHWCASPCGRQFLHDDPFIFPFTKDKTSAKRPANAYICKGCWLYRRNSLTLHALTGEWKDRQAPAKHSWLITPKQFNVISGRCSILLYQTLLQPPNVFCLSLLDNEKDKSLIHLAIVNQHDQIQVETELHFTLNNIPHTYSVYELDQGLRYGTEGRMPGVRALINLLGPFDLRQSEEKKERGRPTNEESKRKERLTEKIVRRSNRN